MAQKHYVKHLMVDHAKFAYKPNFSGRATDINKKGGVREFALLIPDEESAYALKEEGWNVKSSKITEKYPDPKYYIPVEVRFDVSYESYVPHVYLVEDGVDGEPGKTYAEIFESNIHTVDEYEIVDMWMDIRPRWVEHDDGTWHIKAFLSELNLQIEDNVKSYSNRFNRREFYARNQDVE